MVKELTQFTLPLYTALDQNTDYIVVNIAMTQKGCFTMVIGVSTAIYVSTLYTFCSHFVMVVHFICSETLLHCAR